MSDGERPASARQEELLDRAYKHVLAHGLSEVSLRPLAAAIGSSPRVLLYLFDSKDGLVRALLAKARSDELTMLEQRRASENPVGFPESVTTVWQWLADDAHRPLLCLWVEAYGRSLVEPKGAWAGFAHQTVDDWLAVLADSQTGRRRRTTAGSVERTLALAVLRGALLDLLATGDRRRCDVAVAAYVASLHVADEVLAARGRVGATG
jgi:AcrR family transcriptional regulator